MKKGFTLIELLVVVLIIGILSAVALPQYQKSVEKARATEVTSYVNAWKKAQDIYHLENGIYTTDLEELSIKLPELKYFKIETDDQSVDGPRLMVTASENFPMEDFSQLDVYISSDGGTAYGSCWGEKNKKCSQLFCRTVQTQSGPQNRCNF